MTYMCSAAIYLYRAFLLLKKRGQKSIIKKAKRDGRLRSLRRLRRSNPQPAMVSTLDIDNLSPSSEDEEGEEREEGTGLAKSPGIASVIPSRSDSSVSSHPHLSQTCGNCVRLRTKIRWLKDKLHASESQMTLLTQQLSTPQKLPQQQQQQSSQTPPRNKFDRAKTASGPGGAPRYGINFFVLVTYKIFLY